MLAFVVLMFALAGPIFALNCEENQYYSTVASMSYVKREYPFTLIEFDSFYERLGDPCTQFLVGYHDAMIAIKPSIFENTELGNTLCKKRCQNHLTYRPPVSKYTSPCVANASSPTWNTETEPVDQFGTEYNCGDLNLPEGEPLDFYFQIGQVETTLIDQTIDYLSSFQVNSAYLNWDSWGGNFLTEQQVATMLGKLKDVKQLSIEGNYYGGQEPQNATIDTLKEFTNLQSFAFKRYLRAADALAEIANPENVSYIELFKNQLTTLPPALADFTGLLSLYIDEQFHMDLEDALTAQIQVALKNLEMASFRMSNTTNIGGQFLKDSTKLVYLDLSCNAIQTIDPAAFSHLTKLRVLKLVGNPLTALPNTVFHGLSSLQYLDIKGGTAMALSGGTLVRFNFHNGMEYSWSGVCYMRENYDIELSAMESINDDQFAGLPNLERLELTNQAAILNEKVFEPLHDKLKFLNLEDMQISKVADLELHKICPLQTLVLDNNPIGQDEQMLTYDMALNLHNLKELSLKGTDMEKVTGSLVMMSKSILDERGWDLSNMLSFSCNTEVWEALLSKTIAGLPEECVHRYEFLKDEIDEVKDTEEDSGYGLVCGEKDSS